MLYTPPVSEIKGSVGTHEALNSPLSLLREKVGSIWLHPDSRVLKMEPLKSDTEVMKIF